jgi:hypothetical protein
VKRFMEDSVVSEPSTVARPETEEDWIIQAVNIHGLFFERACRKIIEDTHGWQIAATNLPVESPILTEHSRGKESNLDIMAHVRKSDGRDGYTNELTLLVECKKNNPGFIRWLFFPRHTPKGSRHTAISDTASLRQVWLEYNEQLPGKFGVFPRVRRKRLSSSLCVADEAREIRSSYKAYKKDGDKTKTANAAISEAAYQVALATQAIFFSAAAYLTKNLERVSRSDGLIKGLDWARQILIPVIVTSARLYTCDFDPKDVDVASGEIAFSKATINEKKYLLYEYPLPRHLQAYPQFPEVVSREGELDLFERMQIFVVHSSHFTELLTNLAKEDFWTFI